MFANVGWGEMLVLVIAGLVILGPERLPGAIRWTGGAVRQVRDYVTGATSQLRDEFGTDFDDLREPLSELQKLRGMTPRAALTKHLLDGDDSIFTGKADQNGAPAGSADRNGKPQTPAVKPQSGPGPAAAAQSSISGTAGGPGTDKTAGTDGTSVGAGGAKPQPADGPAPSSTTPFDSDAT